MMLVILLTMFNILAPLINTNTDPIQPGRVYTAGTRLNSPWTGISFTVPEGFSAQYESEMGAMLMQGNQDGILLGVWGLSSATPETMGEAVVEIITEQGITLIPQSLEQPDEFTLHARYYALSETGPGVLLGVVHQHERGNAITVAAIGPESATSHLEVLLQSILDSVQWEAPAAANWQALLAGKAFTGMASYGNSPTNAAGANDVYTSETTRNLSFCNTEWYAYSYRSDRFYSSEIASASSQNASSHEGQWWLLSDLAGQAILVLESNEGLEYQWLVEETDQGLVINEVLYQPDGPASCY